MHVSFAEWCHGFYFYFVGGAVVYVYSLGCESHTGVHPHVSNRHIISGQGSVYLIISYVLQI